MNKLFLILIVLMITTPTSSFSHSGGVNLHKCHLNYSTGVFHCHQSLPRDAMIQKEFNNTWCLRRCLSGSLVVRCCGYRSEATCDNASRALIKINPSGLYSGSYKPYCSRQKY